MNRKKCLEENVTTNKLYTSVFEELYLAYDTEVNVDETDASEDGEAAFEILDSRKKRFD